MNTDMQTSNSIVVLDEYRRIYAPLPSRVERCVVQQGRQTL